MGLSHIPSVQSILHKLASSTAGSFGDDNAFDHIIAELEKVRNSWKAVAQEVGGKPERSYEYMLADGAITCLRSLHQMYKGTYAVTMAAEPDDADS